MRLVTLVYECPVYVVVDLDGGTVEQVNIGDANIEYAGHQGLSVEIDGRAVAGIEVR